MTVSFTGEEIRELAGLPKGSFFDRIDTEEDFRLFFVNGEKYQMVVKDIGNKFIIVSMWPTQK